MRNMDSVDGAGLVRLICEQIGYGRVMQLASKFWREKDAKGALSVGPTFAEIEKQREGAAKFRRYVEERERQEDESMSGHWRSED